MQIRLLRASEVGRFEGIALADLRTGKNETPHQLIRGADRRRFVRLQRHMQWIAYAPLHADSVEYRRMSKICYINFRDPTQEHDAFFLSGLYACQLVFETSRLELRFRGVQYTHTRRERMDRLCTLDLHRFFRRLGNQEPELAGRLRANWEFMGMDGPWKPSRGWIWLYKLSSILKGPGQPCEEKRRAKRD